MKQLIILLFFISILFNFCWATQSLELSSWDLEAINASRINYIQDSKNTVKKELYLSLIKEKNQHHSLSFLEKHTLKALLPKQIIENLAGEPVFDSTNHAVFITSKEGWVTKYNLHTGQAEINIRVGLKSANSVLSSNGHFLLVGNQQPANLVFLNPKDLSIVQIIPVQDRKGNLSPVTVVRDAGEVHGFIVIPKHFPQLWKINYLDPPPIGFGDGWNHDYRCLKDHVDKPLFPIKRLRIDQTLRDLYIDQDNIYLLANKADKTGIIFDLDLSRIVNQIDVSSLAPNLIWKKNGIDQLVVLSHQNTALSFYRHKPHWQKWKKEVTLNVEPITAIASCAESDTFLIGHNNGQVQVINKDKHTIEHTLDFKQGRINTLSCTQDKKYILVNTEQSQIIYNL